MAGTSTRYSALQRGFRRKLEAYERGDRPRRLAVLRRRRLAEAPFCPSFCPSFGLGRRGLDGQSRSRTVFDGHSGRCKTGPDLGERVHSTPTRIARNRASGPFLNCASQVRVPVGARDAETRSGLSASSEPARRPSLISPRCAASRRQHLGDQVVEHFLAGDGDDGLAGEAADDVERLADGVAGHDGARGPRRQPARRTLDVVDVAPWRSGPATGATVRRGCSSPACSRRAGRAAPRGRRGSRGSGRRRSRRSTSPPSSGRSGHASSGRRRSAA